MNIKKLIEKRRLQQVKRTLAKVNSFADYMASLSDEELQAKTPYFKKRLAKGESLDSLLPEAFAAMREANKRVLGMYSYDVQVMGGIVLHQGNIAEMRTGEGKTLTATLPVYLNALTGLGVMVITPNSYLAIRDAREMAPVYRFMGLTVSEGIPEDPKVKWKAAKKKEVYAADIIYTTNGGLGFDYLLDNLVTSKEEKYLRTFNYAVVDEIDAVLLDSAQTPLIISGAPRVQSNLYQLSNKFVETLVEEVDYTFDEEKTLVWLTDEGIEEAQRFLGISNIYQNQHLEHVRQLNLALRAHTLYNKEKNYVIEDGEVKLLDVHSGRIMEGTKLQGGQHQAIEAKEYVRITDETRSMASITYQNLFKMFDKLSGMTGTGKTAEDEFIDTYNMEVVTIPTNRPVQRKDRPDVVYCTMPEKIKASMEHIKKIHATGQPILIFTASIAVSEIYSEMLLLEGIAHNVLNAFNTAREAEIISEAGQAGAVTVATALAGRGTDIKLGRGVAELGGLAVVGVERMDNERVDLQIRGRAGRQGDPGSSQFFLSLEDDLVMKWGDKWLKKRYMKGLETADFNRPTPLRSKRITRAIYRCQELSDSTAISARARALDMDASMKMQRELIYRQRNDIMESFSGLSIHQIVDDIISHYFETHRVIDKDDLFRYIYDNFTYRTVTTGKGFDPSNKEAVRRLLHHIVKTELESKKDQLNDENKWSEFYRVAVLKSIDECWVEQVDYLEQLKGAVSNRQLAQLNPMYEYHKESYASFDKMRHRIKEKIVHNLLLSSLVSDEYGRTQILFT